MQDAQPETATRPGVTPDVVQAYLSRLLPDAAGAALTLDRIGGGQSNPTYLVGFGPHRLVLRMPPHGERLPGAHAVDREYRIMAALAGSGVPVPEMIRFEEDEEILGVPFYVMQQLDGRVEHDSALPGLSPADRAAIYRHKAEVLARLHDVDWRAAGLEGFGREGGFFARQIRRWTGQWELSKTREIPEIDQLVAWLPGNIPAGDETTIVHGDYRVGNLMLRGNRVNGVLDWELSTLGHPLADLAHTMTMWHVSPAEYGGIRGCDLAGLGIPSARAFEDTYLAARGLSQGLTPFHHAFALFRFAVIFEGIAARAVAGNAASPEAARVGALSSVFARRAVEALSTDASHA